MTFVQRPRHCPGAAAPTLCSGSGAGPSPRSSEIRLPIWTSVPPPTKPSSTEPTSSGRPMQPPSAWQQPSPKPPLQKSQRPESLIEAEEIIVEEEGEAETQEAGPETQEADQEAEPKRGGAPDTQTTHQKVPAMSIGDLERVLGIVLTVMVVPGGTTRVRNQDTTETLWPEPK